MKLLWMIMLPVAVLMTGCDHCYNVACNEPDVEQINALRFAFDRNSFTYDEVNSAHIVRYVSEGGDPVDTVSLKGTITPGDFSFTLSQPSNDRAAGSAAFVYVIWDNDHLHSYTVSDIETRGIFPTDCCCCYRNTVRTFRLNGEPTDHSGSTEPVLLGK